MHARGVTAWPQEVTAQMVGNFLAGGAVVNALAGPLGATVRVVDVGVAADLAPLPGLSHRQDPRQARRTSRREPAMSRAEALRAVQVGIEVARTLVGEGAGCLLGGDMGIANTTPSAALTAAFTGSEPATVTGRGTGIDGAAWELKVEVVRAGLARHQPDPADPLGVLATVGGFEHAALTGFYLGAAAMRVPVVLDGVTPCAAALAAQAFAPDSVAALVAGPSIPGAWRIRGTRLPGPAAAARPRPAPRRRHRGAARAADRAGCRSSLAGGGDLRQCRRHGQGSARPR